jgi:hypothetical protein
VHAGTALLLIRFFKPFLGAGCGRHRRRWIELRGDSPGTYAMLENKLSWAPGSIDTILAGGEPKELVAELRRTTHNPLPRASTEALSRAPTEELLLELRRRIIAPRDTRHDTWDDWDSLDSRGDLDSLDSRGEWPEQG